MFDCLRDTGASTIEIFFDMQYVWIAAETDWLDRRTETVVAASCSQISANANNFTA